MRRAFLSLAVLFAVVTPSNALTIEFLQASINPDNAAWLSGIACRNLDHIIHLDIAVDWPNGSLEVENSGYKRLVFWGSEDEYLFPTGSFFLLHGSYIIKGYFIARSGGVHQGVASNSFDKISDAQVMLTPGISENQIRSGRCP